jgi:hypothetical protein
MTNAEVDAAVERDRQSETGENSLPEEINE